MALKITRCPWCKARHQEATGLVKIGEHHVIEPTPDNGSISVCVYCWNWSIFDDQRAGGLRIPTPDEILEAHQDHDNAKLLDGLSKMKAHNVGREYSRHEGPPTEEGHLCE